jgi:membrane protease subunit (stomatin/prohibitin family)
MAGKIMGQLRSVIEWTDPDDEALFERWTEHGDEIKNASKLIVGPGQGCIFVYEGAVKAVIQSEGVVNLETDNVPFWTTIKSLMQRFESHHKVGIYYFRTGHLVNKRWGTTSVIKYDDPKYKFPVGLGAYGNYSVRITEPEAFFRNIVQSAAFYGAGELRQVILSRITQPLTDYLATASFSYAEIDANRQEIVAGIMPLVTPIFTDLGFELLDFRIEGTSFDEDTERRIGRIADMHAEAQALAAVGVSYQEQQQLEALKAAAANEGGGTVGMGVGMGAGLGLGQMMAGMAAGQQQQAPQQAAPAQPAADDPMEKLKKLKVMFDNGLINEEEYSAKKAEILAQM